MSGSVIVRQRSTTITLLDVIHELRGLIVREGVMEFKFGNLKVSGADWYLFSTQQKTN